MTWLHFVPSFSKRYRILITGFEMCLFALAGLLAFLLRFDFIIPRQDHEHLIWGLGTWIVCKTIVFQIFSLTRGLWRYVSLTDLFKICVANVTASAVSTAFLLAFGPAGFPRSVYVLDLIFSFLAITGVRVASRIIMESISTGKQTLGERTAIYGTERAGVMLLRGLKEDPNLNFTVCGFLDDNFENRGRLVHGIPVLGPGAELTAIATKYAIQQVLIAVPSACGPQLTQILNWCHEANVKCKIVPSLPEVLASNAQGPKIRDIRLEDLLGRVPVLIDNTEARKKISGQVVMVTGAGGSIGSELCRQIASMDPEALVLFDIAETPLYQIDYEIKTKYRNLRVIPEIGSVQSLLRLREVMGRHSPIAVYHAAAFKHVTMMEHNIFEAIENNILGTYNVMSAAKEAGVRDFVLISTDKAVRPSSVMGVSKRVAEMMCLSMNSPDTKCVSVRFGNVLGSNGSVIPLFTQQIASGGPVTVTHADVERYFMTIPEAVHLVLQASTMGNGGEIFVLDMGEPVKIVDLAHNLILLSGLRPGVDIEIKFVGLHPGEKLREELKTFEESTLPTSNQKIRVFFNNHASELRIREQIERFRTLCRDRDSRQLMFQLKELVPDYNPSTTFLRECMYVTDKAYIMASSK